MYNRKINCVSEKHKLACTFTKLNGEEYTLTDLDNLKVINNSKGVMDCSREAEFDFTVPYTKENPPKKVVLCEIRD